MHFLHDGQERSDFLLFARETVAKSCKKHLTTKLLTGILVGLVICGIPLAVMSSLYVQKSIEIRDLIIE